MLMIIYLYNIYQMKIANKKLEFYQLGVLEKYVTTCSYIKTEAQNTYLTILSQTNSSPEVILTKF